MQVYQGIRGIQTNVTELGCRLKDIQGGPQKVSHYRIVRKSYTKS